MSDDLRRLAEAATPGPWRAKGRTVLAPSSTVIADALDVLGVPREDTAAYIAACDPQTILGLLGRLERLDAAWQRLVLTMHQHAPSPLSHGLGVWCGCGWSTEDDGGRDWIDHVLDDASSMSRTVSWATDGPDASQPTITDRIEALLLAQPSVIGRARVAPAEARRIALALAGGLGL